MIDAESPTCSKFLSALYWLSGFAAFYWTASVFVCGTRPYTEVALPILGTCVPSEAMVFTLILAWIPILVSHLVVHEHQRQVQLKYQGEATTDANGAPVWSYASWVPADINGLRVRGPIWLPHLCAFFVLVLAPTLLYFGIALQAEHFLRAVPESRPGVAEDWKKFEKWPEVQSLKETYTKESVRGWSDLLGRWGEKGNTHDWRWRHAYLEWRPRHSQELYIGGGEAKDPRYRHLEQVNWQPVLTSAARWQPYALLAICAMLVISLAWMLLVRPLRCRYQIAPQANE